MNENQYFYSKETNAFYHSSVHSVEQMSSDVVPITDEQHDELLIAINSGCIIFDDLTVSTPRPSQFHNWNGTEWVLDERAQLENTKTEQANEKKRLQTEVTVEINELSWAVEEGIASDEDAAYYKALNTYRYQLRSVDTDIVPCEFPKHP